VKVFKAPKISLGDLDAETAATLIATAADIALVLDGNGVIEDIAIPRIDLASELSVYGRALGRQWAEIVSEDSKLKVEELLREAAPRASASWRQINHQAAGGAEIPLLFSAVKIDRRGRAVAIGRDLRAIAKLQQQLVEAQVTMERDYSRLRHMETRYRLLFQFTSEAALIVDASTHKIAEANPAASTLLGIDESKIIGRPFGSAFDADSAESLKAMLAGIRAAGRVGVKTVRLAHDPRELTVSASLFRQGNVALYLVRLIPDGQNAPAIVDRTDAALLKFVEISPDGIIITDRHGRIISANAAFVDMAQLATIEQARGQLLERWLGRPGVDLNVLLSSIKQHGSVRLFATSLRGEYGAPVDIEVSAVPLADEDDEQRFGFAIRNVGLRLSPNPRPGRELPRSADQLTELVGRAPLKDIVQETTDVIEQLCIEAALQITGDNRASAAEILGLSRQSLYVKLRRYGFADANEDREDTG
jgi:transcriptional regulator PpsR